MTSGAKDSFFDRMSRTETFASATMKGMLRQKHEEPSPSPKIAYSPRNRSSSRTSTLSSRSGYTTSSFFDRLSKTETLSSLQKKKSLHSRPETPDAAKNFHNGNRKWRPSPSNSEPTPTTRSRPFFTGSSYTGRAPSYASYGGSKHNSSPSNQSLGSARSARSTYTSRSARSAVTTTSARSTPSARTATRSVATTRSVTTARSSAATITTMRSSRSGYAAQNATVRAATVPTVSPRYASSRGYPPPSPANSIGRSSPRPTTTTSPERKSIMSRSSPKTATSPETRGYGQRMPTESRTSPRTTTSPETRGYGQRMPTETRSSPRTTTSPEKTRGHGQRIPTPPPATKKEIYEPKPAPPRPPPPPRETLKFDEDDELSFGSDSDEASLGPSSVQAAPQDAGSVASKSIASKKSVMSVKEERAMAAAALTVDTMYEPEKEEKSNFTPTVYEQEMTDDESGDEQHVDDFLDELDQKSEEEEDAEIEQMEHVAEEAEAAAEVYVREPIIQESDDGLSVGSDESNDNDSWAGGETKAADNGDHEDEMGDMLYVAESTDREPAESYDEPVQDGTPSGMALDEPEEEEDEYEPEEEEPVVKEDEYEPEEEEPAVEEDEYEPEEEEPVVEEDEYEPEEEEPVVVEEEEPVQEVKTEEEEDDMEYDDADDMEYGDEDEDEIPEQGTEDDYDEAEDLEQMDSLDLILDATHTNEEDAPSVEREEVIMEGEEEFGAQMVESNEESQCKYTILKSEKYHPEYGFEEMHPDDLYLTETLQAFEDGEISNEEISVLLIEALFERDFAHGEHWEIDPGTAREMEEDEGGGGELEGRAFVVKRQARLDWNDLYSVAAAKGTIIIWPEKNEIRVENYSYFVAG